MRRVLAFFVTGGLVIGLGGCAMTGDESGAGPVPASTSPAASLGTESSADGGAKAAGSAGCLHGTWLADNAFFLASLQEFGDAIDIVTGRVTLTFSPDGALATEYSGWLLNGTNEGAAVTIARTGIDTGRYSISDDNVTIEETSVGSTLIVTSAGREMPLVPTPAIYSNAAFTCDEASASITTPDGTMLLTRE